VGGLAAVVLVLLLVFVGLFYLLKFLQLMANRR